MPTFESILAPPARQQLSRTVNFGILSTHPPTLAGPARFNAALSAALRAHGSAVEAVDVEAGEPVTADSLNRTDVAVIQHEYSIFGGADGDEVIDVFEKLRVPSVLVAHSIPKDPTPHQRSILETIASMADRVVAMSGAAQQRLCLDYGVDRRKVVVIPHGATIPTSPRVKRASRPTILTWGLVAPGKGIERVIEAMASLRDVAGRPRYMVVGPTPDGCQAYRDGLVEQARSSGVADSVTFDPRPYEGDNLPALIQSAAVIVLPYDSTDKVASGVLVDAVASGRPVVATGFPHAVELLSCGAGIVVDHDDPAALLSALRRVLTQPRLAGAMAAEARQVAPDMAWPVVARAYIDLAQRLLAERKAAR